MGQRGLPSQSLSNSLEFKWGAWDKIVAKFGTALWRFKGWCHPGTDDRMVGQPYLRSMWIPAELTDWGRITLYKEKNHSESGGGGTYL